jgi:hypothetical protein
MYHTPLTWYEQEKLEHKAHIQAFPLALWFLRLYSFKDRSNLLHNNLPPVLVLIQLNPVQVSLSYFLKIHVNIIHTSTLSSSK